MTAFDKKINQIATRHRWNIEKQARAAVQRTPRRCRLSLHRRPAGSVHRPGHCAGHDRHRRRERR